MQPIMLNFPPWLVLLIELSAVFIVLTVVTICIGIPIILIWAWFSAKKTVKKAPREPMFTCDIHGMFPERCALDLEVEGSQSNTVKMCPFCVRDRIKKAKTF